MSVIFAPTIMFQNILVCGQALEINCVNDLHMKTTLSDLSLISSLVNDFGKICSAVATTTQQSPDAQKKNIRTRKYQRRPSARPKPPIPRMVQESARSEHDSGFKSNSKKEVLMENGCEAGVKPPFTLSFVGGYFTIKFYKSLVRMPLTFCSPQMANITNLSFIPGR